MQCEVMRNYYNPLMPADSEHEFQVMDQAPDIFVNSSEYTETSNFAIVCLVFYCILLPIYLFVLLKNRYKSIFDKPGAPPPACARQLRP